MTYYGNRGQLLENMIETSNARYQQEGLALIQKIPTPVKVLDLNSRTGRITSGFYDKKSTVDYIGVYRGKPIAFDAKQTNTNTRFDLSNVHDHQYRYMKRWQDNGGISFLIVRFNKLDENYLLPFELLKIYWEGKEQGGRKSIPYKAIAEDEYKISSRGLLLLDYLSVVDKEVAEWKQ